MDIKENIISDIWEAGGLCKGITIRQDVFFEIVNTTFYLDDKAKLKLILKNPQYYFGVPLTINNDLTSKEYELK